MDAVVITFMSLFEFLLKKKKNKSFVAYEPSWYGVSNANEDMHDEKHKITHYISHYYFFHINCGLYYNFTSIQDRSVNHLCNINSRVYCSAVYKGIYVIWTNNVTLVLIHNYIYVGSWFSWFIHLTNSVTLYSQFTILNE